MELELQMRHFLVNIEQISFSFLHSPRQLLPRVVSGWTAQSAHPSLPDSDQGSPVPLLGATLSASLKFDAFCFIYHQDFIYQDLYYCKPSGTTAALRASQGLLLVLSTPNEQHLEPHTPSGFSQQLQNPDQCWRAHTPALQASDVNSMAQFNIKKHNLHKATNFQKYYTEPKYKNN